MCSRNPCVRALAILVLVGCQAGANPDQLVGGGSSRGACALDADCVLAAPSCCECPTFAVALSDPAHAGCATVGCPPLDCPNAVRAFCDAGTCALACAPLACDQTCADGFAIGAATGCLACACASITDPACSADTDCARTRADCCGCARGGHDTAVLAGDVATFDAALGCPANPSCPATDTCAPDLGPRCIEGACQLLPPAPAGACGRADLPACPDGLHCIINVDADATAQGVGVCM